MWRGLFPAPEGIQPGAETQKKVSSQPPPWWLRLHASRGPWGPWVVISPASEIVTLASSSPAVLVE
jgi:hypothetical protein